MIGLKVFKEKLDKFLYFSGAFLLLVILVLVSLEVFFRFIVGRSLPWASEISTIALVWMVFISSTYAITKKANLKIEIFYNMFPVKLRKLVVVLTNILYLGLFVLLLTVGYQYTTEIYFAKTTALRISQSVFYVAIPATAIFALYYSFLNIKEAFSGKSLSRSKEE